MATLAARVDFNWGRAAFEAGAYADAIGPLSRYLKQNPGEQGARRVLGISQFLTHDFASARTTLAPLAGNPAEAPQLQFAYADSLLKTGDATDAFPRLEALSKLQPAIPGAQAAFDEARLAVTHSSRN
jgi:predicted Zn-dependent protease